MGLEVVGRSDVGRVRLSNEDSYGFDLRQASSWFAMVWEAMLPEKSPAK